MVRTRAQTQWMQAAILGTLILMMAGAYQIYTVLSFHEYPSEMDVFEEIIARIDQDGDGKVSEDEFEQFSSTHQSFRALDTDGNDLLDAVEVGHAVMNSEPGFKRLPSLSAPPGRGGPP